MKTRSNYHTLGLALCASITLQSAHAASTVTQTFDFPFESTAVIPDSADLRYIYLPSNYEATVTPFNTTLGVLESVIVKWTFTASFNGTTTSGAPYGTTNLNFSGSTTIAGATYGGNGTGGGNSSPGGSPISMTAAPMSGETEFTAAKAGVSQNPIIWPAVSGSSPYSAKFSATSNTAFSYQNLASGRLNSNTGLVVTYNYAAAAVPEPSGCALLGLGLALGMCKRRRPA